MAKDLRFEKEAITEMLRGIDIVGNAVGGTLGPKGRNVYIDDPMFPKVINDGATIAQNIELADPFQNMGVKILKNTSGQTNDNAGDGTTTTAVLTQALIHACVERPENPIQVRDSVRIAAKKALELLNTMKTPVSTSDIERVARISSENEELTKMITEIIKKIGKKAVITIEDSRTFSSSYEIVSGYETIWGFLSPYFINDPKDQRLVYEDVPVFVSEKKISNVIDLDPILKVLVPSDEQGNHSPRTNTLVIVCEDIDPAVLGILVANHVQKRFNFAVIRATGDALKDIAGVCGATAVSDETGVSLQKLEWKHFGKVKKIISTAKKTLFVPTLANAIDYGHVLAEKAKAEKNEYLKKQLIERAAKVEGAIGVIRIGAATDFERENLKYKAEDAVKAVLSALEEGIVEGGGMTLFRISEKLSGNSVGEQIMRSVLKSPLRKIIENSGKDYADILRGMKADQGYDAKNDKYVNMISAGIIDPAKVERCAIENSVSAATEFITSFCAISDEKIEQEK